jgi:hypothetical protein
MSWLLFMDESGHDHRSMPYEVRGGFAIHASKLWSFIQSVKDAERNWFGTHLHEVGSECKGSKLLNKDRLKWASQDTVMEQSECRKHALNFLNNSRQKRSPRRDEFTAYGQACLFFSLRVFELLKSHDAFVFAAAIPREVRAPYGHAEKDYLRKDQVFLLERFFYFLEQKNETGLLVFDRTEKWADRRFVQRMERYFSLTTTGRYRTSRIVPVPIFVDSDMTYGVQVADLCIYAINWGFRLPQTGMNAPIRKDVQELFAAVIGQLQYHGEGYRNGKTFLTHSIVFVPDPYEARA